MSYTIAITGKGGVAKTTVAALVVRRLIASGRRPVLAVDADPNTCLDIALGVKGEHTVGGVREEARVLAARSVGRRLGIGVAVVNDVHTHGRERQVLQDVLTCIRLGTTVEKAGRRLFPNAERIITRDPKITPPSSAPPATTAVAAASPGRCRCQ